MKLEASDIHLWLAFDREFVDEGVLRSFEELLEPAERSRAARMRAENLPRQYLVTRSLQRRVLSRYEPSIAPDQWRFEEGPHGKPRVARQFHPLGLQFNLAHTSCLVVMAIARHEIGVDAEHLSGRMPAPGVIDRYLTAGERDELLALPGAQRSARFRAIWSLKEAWIKATGEGLGADLSLASFRFSDALRAREFVIRGDDLRRWQFWQSTASPEHVVSIASADAPVPTVARMFRCAPAESLVGEPLEDPRPLAPGSGQEQRTEA